MHVLKDPESDPETSEMLRALNLLEFSSMYESLVTRLRRSNHAQIVFAMPPG
jgi:hypothetical protein